MTLEDIKKYLKIDYDDDDDILSELLVISSEYIDLCVGTDYKSDERALKLCALLQRKLISDMYEQRGTEVPSNTKKDIIVTTILDKLSNYCGVE